MKNKIIFGFHTINSIIKNKVYLIKKVYINNRYDLRMKNMLNVLKKLNINIIDVNNNYLFNITKTHNNQGIAAKIKKTNILYKKRDILKNILNNSLFLIIDKIKDPHNLGACLRVANCAGVNAVIITKYNTVKLNKTVIKTSSGAYLNTPYLEVSNLINIINLLKNKGVWIIGMNCCNSNKSLYKMNFSGSFAIIVGSEEKGIRKLIKKNCDFLITIPMFGTVESLNVSVALGICLYEIRRQQSLFF